MGKFDYNRCWFQALDGRETNLCLDGSSSALHHPHRSLGPHFQGGKKIGQLSFHFCRYLCGSYAYLLYFFSLKLIQTQPINLFILHDPLFLLYDLPAALSYNQFILLRCHDGRAEDARPSDGVVARRCAPRSACGFGPASQGGSIGGLFPFLFFKAF